MSGLNFLHENGIVHENLRPANVCWDSTFQVRIGDFARVARTFGASSMTNLSEPLGSVNSLANKDYTMNYKPPEMIATNDYIDASLRDKIGLYTD